MRIVLDSNNYASFVRIALDSSITTFTADIAVLLQQALYDYFLTVVRMSTRLALLVQCVS
jgi:hypothetical protein